MNTNTDVATYFPNPGFVGTDQFTFAAYDGSKNSNLATGTVVVAQGPFSIGAAAYVPPTYPAAWPVAFTVVPAVTNNAAPVTFDWDFGDGSTHSTNQYAAHAYALPGTYNWSVISTVSTASTTNNGTIVIGDPVQLTVARRRQPGDPLLAQHHRRHALWRAPAPLAHPRNGYGSPTPPQPARA